MNWVMPLPPQGTKLEILKYCIGYTHMFSSPERWHHISIFFMLIRERIDIRNAGVFLYIIYPGAFVEIDTHDMKELSGFKQLCVLCAGVWHNLITFLLGYLILNTGLFASSLSHTLWRSVDGMGVSVTSVEKASIRNSWE